MNISPADKQKYSGIFQAQQPINGKISGHQAKGVFMQSGLALPLLGQIWNLCDIDRDGQMDQDEFVLAMHFIFSSLNGALPTLPQNLPPQLIPPSKSQYFPNQTTLPTQTYTQPPTSNQSYGQASALPPIISLNSKTFDWHINSSDKARYDSYFNRFCRPGQATVDQQALKSFLLEKLNSPDEVLKAWNLVDVRNSQNVSRDQFCLLVHILDSRNKGIPVPDNIPIHLKNRFLGISSQPSVNSNTSYNRSNFPNQAPLMPSYQAPQPNPSYHPPPPPTSNQHSMQPLQSQMTSDQYRSNSTSSWNSEPVQSQIDQGKVQENREQEAKLKEELSELDKKLAVPVQDNSTAYKTKQELEEFLAYLQKIEQLLPPEQSSKAKTSDEETELIKDLEYLANSIRDKHAEMSSILALQKRELEELELAINKKKYGV